MSQGREQQVGRVNEIDCCNADLIRFLFLRANRDGTDSGLAGHRISGRWYKQLCGETFVIL